MGSVGGSKQKNTSWTQAQSASLGESANESSQWSRGYGQQSIYADQAPFMRQLYGVAGDLLGGDSAEGRRAAGVGQQAQQAWQQSLRPGGNPYFERNVQAAIDQATQSFKRQVMPGMVDQAVAGGQLGAPRDRLQRGEATGLFGQGIAQMVGGMYGQQYGVDQAARMQALGMTPMMQGAAFAPMQQAQSMIGAPVVLSRSGTASKGWSEGYGSNVSQSSAFGGSAGKGGSANIGVMGKG